MQLWQTRILRTTRFTLNDEIEGMVTDHLGDPGHRLRVLLRVGSWIDGENDEVCRRAAVLGNSG
jgi:hypothetical protein